jgi:diadenosine tetraphosphate (Ap4A) HIT family hydrolase
MTTPDPDPGFQLDPKIAALTKPWAEWTLSRALIMDDSRFPWLMLVPRRAGAVEIYALEKAERAELVEEIARASRLLAHIHPGWKINVAALGNAVRQLHVHVVARHDGDAAWPRGVWGFGTAVPYAEPALAELRARLDAARREIG